MNASTKAQTIATLARTLFDVSSDVARRTCEAAAVNVRGEPGQQKTACDQIVGTLLDLGQQIEALKSVHAAILTIHRQPSTDEVTP